LEPEEREVSTGRVEVRQIFRVSRFGTIAGCFVTSGTIERSSRVRVIRDGRVIYTGGLQSMRRTKDDVREVREGFECGLKVSNYDDVKPGDEIEAFRIEKVARKLS